MRIVSGTEGYQWITGFCCYCNTHVFSCQFTCGGQLRNNVLNIIDSDEEVHVHVIITVELEIDVHV